jgi:hypothetical protein
VQDSTARPLALAGRALYSENGWHGSFFNWTKIGLFYLPNRSAQRASLQPEHGSTVCMRGGICNQSQLFE